MGAISEEEYEQKKQILLKDIWYFYLLLTVELLIYNCV